MKDAKANAKDICKPTDASDPKSMIEHIEGKSYVNLYFISYVLFLEPYKYVFLLLNL